MDFFYQRELLKVNLGLKSEKKIFEHIHKFSIDLKNKVTVKENMGKLKTTFLAVKLSK